MRAYSLDLRKKVMAAYHQTQHKSEVCKRFNIARSTLDEWILLEQTTQDLKPLPAIRNGRPFSIKDLESFEEFVKSTPFTQIRDLLDPFEQKFGYKVSYSVLWRGLHKIGRAKKRN
ncbi:MULTISPECIES: IS630 transposase-related protein [unclassified Acinetobacter]|uniref:IS630 transposase-related protein n=1 Tax=unclassified Acinetobacter TaxID=196816 RepID=UPI00244832C3|nr:MULTISPECIES: IS630 transposase-related protein [unclassified Acinetobacter]MDH0032589.1 IS630 transposase-related protein [Acinetobacter sp. GD04021]MDH0886897.1 IS630 transposase-related protein [Acinetobacter sp. GD03873]MDH1083290.1 IS630 transposase-related protein [Acinetobacter sp. GD03983]MDH2190213.1 IS630 transposase-related protein [Acinetobacter sp. GD03645]MDH2203308.1 IS630 transposase-related protein [Acinetobacter sp. GD03647]